MDDTGDSILAQRNGNANARCEWALRQHNSIQKSLCFKTEAKAPQAE